MQMRRLPSVPPTVTQFFQHPWACALLVFLAAALIRGIFLWQVMDAPIFSMRMVDAASYHEWARRIASGAWMGDEVFYQAPLYPYFLAVLYAGLGDSLMTVRVVQLLLGSLSCALLATAGRRFFSPSAGLAAGLLAACYAPSIFYDYLIQKSVLDTFFLSLGLVLLGGLLQQPSRKRLWWSLGLTMGALALTRENSIALMPILLLWLCQRLNGSARRGAVALLLGGFLTVLIPVAMRNFAVGGEFHMTTSQFGPNFYIGNNEDSRGTYIPLRPGRDSPEFERIDAAAIAEEAAGRRLSAGEVSNFWTRRALEFISAHPGRWLALLARKLALAVNGVEIIDGEDIYTYTVHSSALRLLLPVFNFGVLAPLAILGIWVTWQERHRTWIMLALGSTYLASLVLFYVFGRYRHPLAPLFILFAAAGVVAAPRVLRQPPVGRAMLLGLTVVVAALLCNLPLIHKESMMATTHYNVGKVLSQRGHTNGAILEYLAAIRLSSGNAPMHNNLGDAYSERGEIALAIQHFETAIRLAPDYAEPLYNLGMIHLRTGDLLRAAAAFEQYLHLRPDDAEARGFLEYVRHQIGEG